MPYIDPEQRYHIDLHIERAADEISTPGQLNYAITKLLITYVAGEVSYTRCNEIIGVLTCVAQEFYRRLVAPYEDKKKLENGDVF